MPRTLPEKRRRSIRTRRIEGVALGLLAMLPIVPYATFLLGAGVDRAQVFGDLARLEQAARHVGHGETWNGPWSELGWHHPGPAFFYIAAPITSLFGSSSTGLFLAAAFVNAIAAGAMVFCARYYARRAHAIAAMFGSLSWFLAFGNVAANPTSSAVSILPLMSFLVCVALFAKNRNNSSVPGYFAVVLGAIAAQTNVMTAPTVIVCTFAAGLAHGLGVKQRGGLKPKEQWRLIILAALLVLVITPVLIEQTTAPSETAGNLTRLWRFFVSERPSRVAELSTATQHWTTTTSLLPLRIVHRALADDGATPAMLTAAEMPHGVTAVARAIAFVQVFAATIAAVVAVRRGDNASLVLIGFGVLADIVGVVTMQLWVGPATREAVFWLTAGSTVTWMGIVSTHAMSVGSFAEQLPRFTRFIAPTLIVIDLTAAVTATSLQRYWISRHPIAPGSRPDLANDLRTLETNLRQRLDKDGGAGRPVLHRDGAREVADGLLLELEKDRVEVAFPRADAIVYAGGLRRIAPEASSTEPAAQPLHLYLTTTSQPLAPTSARCTEPLARSGDLALYGVAGALATPCDAR